MFFKKLKIWMTLMLVLVLSFAFCAGASAFSMGEFDPNSGEGANVQWANGGVRNGASGEVYENGYYSDEDGKFYAYDSEANEYYEISTQAYTDKAVPVREPLEADLCVPCAEYVVAEESFTAEVDYNRIAESMAVFYDLTGVQPYLILRSDPEKDEAAAQSYEEEYDELFSDGGHLLVIFTEYGSYAEYGVEYYAGKDAKRVADYNSCEKLCEYINTCSDNGLSYEDTFCRSFEKAADYIMYGTDCDIINDYGKETAWVPEYYLGAPVTQVPADGAFSNFTNSIPGILMLVVMFAVFLLSIIFIIGVAVKKNAEDRKAFAPTGKVSKKKLRSENIENEETEAEHEHYDSTVHCPNCGAANCLSENGHCRYCGIRLK